MNDTIQDNDDLNDFDDESETLDEPELISVKPMASGQARYLIELYWERKRLADQIDDDIDMFDENEEPRAKRARKAKRTSDLEDFGTDLPGFQLERGRRDKRHRPRG